MMVCCRMQSQNRWSPQEEWLNQLTIRTWIAQGNCQAEWMLWMRSKEEMAITTSKIRLNLRMTWCSPLKLTLISKGRKLMLSPSSLRGLHPLECLMVSPCLTRTSVNRCSTRRQMTRLHLEKWSRNLLARIKSKHLNLKNVSRQDSNLKLWVEAGNASQVQKSLPSPS